MQPIGPPDKHTYTQTSDENILITLAENGMMNNNQVQKIILERRKMIMELNSFISFAQLDPVEKV